jgi:outer membrane protein assembly factor BamB
MAVIRRWIPRGALACLFGMSAVLAWAEEWPRWGGPRGDETWNAPRLRETFSASGPRRVWRQSVGGGFGGISVADGLVYLMDRVTVPREQERLLCFEAKSGKPLWSHAADVTYGKLDYGNGPRSTPTVFDGRVYTLGAVGRVLCVNARTGKEYWSKNYPLEYGEKIPAPTWGLAASPLIFENLVIVHPGAPDGGGVIALDRKTGKEVWRASDDPAGYATPLLIDAPSGTQLVCWTPENIIGLDPRRGTIHWSIPYKVTYGVSIATPVFHDDILFVTGYWEGSKAIRLGKKPTDAHLVWEENRFLRGLMAQPICRDGYVYTIDKTHGLTCFELLTGNKLWDDGHQTTERGHNPHTSLTWLGDDDRAILLNENGDLILARLDKEGYHEQSRANIIARKEKSPIWAHPAYAGTRAFARSDTELICVELPVAAPPTDP